MDIWHAWHAHGMDLVCGNPEPIVGSQAAAEKIPSYVDRTNDTCRSLEEEPKSADR